MGCKDLGNHTISICIQFTMSACKCEKCVAKREKFMNIIQDMSKGYGTAKKKIQRNLHDLPDKFIDDLRSVMTRMRSEGGNKHLNKGQRDFFQKYRRNLSDFVKSDPRNLLGKKKTHNDRRTTLSQALAQTIHSNPKAFENAINSIQSQH